MSVFHFTAEVDKGRFRGSADGRGRMVVGGLRTTVVSGWTAMGDGDLWGLMPATCGPYRAVSANAPLERPLRQSGPFGQDGGSISMEICTKIKCIYTYLYEKDI